MIDKIITLIVLYYVLKFIYRLISKEEEKKRDAGRQPHIPPARPTPPPSPKTETRTSPRPNFSSTWREISQVLRDLKSEMEGRQDGIKIPEKIPAPHQEVTVTHHTKRIKAAQKDRAFNQKRIHPKKLTEEKVPLVKAKTIREEKIERYHIYFDQPGLFLQGIILAEILRPPMARRDHLLPPYMRG